MPVLGARAGAALAVGPTIDPLADAAARWEWHNLALQRRLELAAGGSFWLALDPDGSALRLKLGGVDLAIFPTETLEQGAPRVLFTARPVPPWHDTIWVHGTLQPERVVQRTVLEITPGADQDGLPLSVPPAATDAIAVPVRYFIRFSGGLALEVTSPEGRAASGWWRRTAAGAGDILSDVRLAASADRDLVRLRLRLAREDAETLYRALPESVALLASSVR